MRRFVLTIFTLVFSCASVWAQVTAQIHGTVQDSSGSSVPGAEVKATQTNTGVVRAATTGSDGDYVLINLPIGPYQLEVSKEGFTKFVQSGIVLDANSDPAINPSLTVGAVTEQVVVEAAASQVQTRESSVGSVTTSQSILQLPLNGRQATDLIVLSGAAVNNNGVAGDVLTGRDVGGAPHLQVAGGSIFSTGYLLDGANYVNVAGVQSLPMPFPDALEEFRVVTSGAATTDARSAEVSAVTKSGSNALHGDLFEFIRNDVTTARNFFASTKSILKRNQFGGTIGGPILKNKLFFFAGHQQTILRADPSSAIAFLPTPAMLQGDFTTFESPRCNAGVQKNLRAPFVGNTVSPSALSTVGTNLAKRILATAPTPTDCGVVTYGSPQHENTWQPVGRIDYQLTDKHSLFGRYAALHDKQPNGLTFSKNVLNSATAGSEPFVQAFTLGETYLVSPNTINSFRASVSRVHTLIDAANFFSLCDVGANMYCGYDPFNITMNVSGAFILGSGNQNKTPQNPNGSAFFTNSLEAKDDLTLVRGAHQISIGGSIGLTRFWEYQTFFTAAQTFVTGAFTGSGMSDLLTGRVTVMTQSAPFTYFVARQVLPVLYATDTWKATRNLTIIAGVRWEPFLPPDFPGNTAHNFDVGRFLAGTQSTVFKNVPAGWYYNGDPGFPGRSGSYKRLANFSPRLGLAWDPKGDGKMSVRASYSLSYAVVGGHWWEGPAQDPPFAATDIQLSAVSLDNPWASYPGGNPFPQTHGGTYPAYSYANSTPYELRTPYTGSWNFAVQRQLGRDWVVSANYIGSQTVHAWYGTQLNPAVFIPGQCPAGQYGLTAPGPCSTTANSNQRRILNLQRPNGIPLSNIDSLDDGGTASYEGLLLSAQHRFSQGFNLQTNYTWSHCLDLSQVVAQQGAVSQGGAYNMLNDRRYDKGNCYADRRHIFNLTAVFQSPRFSRRVLRIAASDWQLAPIYQHTSGSPLNITAGSDVQLNGNSDQNGNIYERPNQILSNPYSTGNATQWLNPLAFSVPAPGTFGNLARNSVIGPAFWQFNLSLSRQFPITERQRLEIRAEAFNVTNSFIPANPTGSTNGAAPIAVTSATFGRLTLAYNPRIVQFGLKYFF